MAVVVMVTILINTEQEIRIRAKADRESGRKTSNDALFSSFSILFSTSVVKLCFFICPFSDSVPRGHHPHQEAEQCHDHVQPLGVCVR